jgi:thiamine-phosphate pyrophosphorylase
MIKKIDCVVIYIFVKKIEDINLNNLKKFLNIEIIYEDQFFNVNNFLKISFFCKKNHIKLYIIDDFNKAIKYKLNGILINNKTFKYYGNPLCRKSNFKILGKAHNQKEYALRIKQGCKLIFLSPIFATHKYSKYSILGVVRFNLISLNWKMPISALGGISYKNYKIIKSDKLEGFGGISIINNGKIKKPVYLLKNKRAFKN